MERDELRRADALNQYWDDRVQGRQPLLPAVVDAETAGIVERIDALAEPPDRNAARAWVWHELARHPLLNEPVPVSTTAAAGVEHGASHLPSDQMAHEQTPRLARSRGAAKQWSMTHLATAALIAITLVAVYVALVATRDTRKTAGPVGVTPTGAWPSFRGSPGNTGAATGPGPDGTPTIRWQAPIAAGKASAAVAGGVVYAGSTTGDLVAIDVETREERWRVPIWPARTTAFALRAGVSSPVVADGLVFVGAEDGVHALDAASGKERWHATTPAIRSSPVVAGGVVYVGDTSGGLHALDAATGAERWRFAGTAPLSSPAVTDGMVYVVDTASSGDEPIALHAVETATGRERWRFELASSDEEFPWSPAVADGTVYVWGVAVPSRRTLYAVDVATGRERWRFAVEGAGWDTEVLSWDASPAIADGIVYVGAEQAAGGVSTIYALDAATGGERWRRDVEGWLAASPVVTDGVLYVGGGSRIGGGHLYAVDAATGSVRWRVDMDGPVGGSPAVAEGMVYVTIPDGDLYAVGGDANGVSEGRV